ncbi:MAG TPA: hypothetical protein VH561_17840 [Micromonosporaceae bacterium]|jgi:2-phosphoglycerate kinase
MDLRREAPPLVVVVCGASGVGKTRAAAALAARYGVPLGEADDIVTALRALTNAEQQPELHYWATHPEAGSWPPTRIADLHFETADALRPAFAAVIADHVEFAAPVVMEGDYLTPELATEHPDRVVAVVLAEPDEARVVANFRSREPLDGEQRIRAQVSVIVGERLAARARRCGALVVATRPWADQVDRLDAVLRTRPGNR